jgi:hypothetical protein
MKVLKKYETPEIEVTRFDIYENIMDDHDGDIISGGEGESHPEGNPGSLGDLFGG